MRLIDSAAGSVREAGLLKMSDDFTPSIARELASDERVLWQGRPRGDIRLRGSDFFLIPVSLLWGGFAIFWEAAALFIIPKKDPAAWLFPLFGIPFVLFGLYFIFGRFIVDKKMRERTEYAVTNRRAIIVSGFFTRKVRSINLQSTPEITLTERADKSGTITFGAGQPFVWWAQSSLWFPGASSQPSFEMIENVRSVNDIIDGARRT
jgi:hypothetical protein